MVAAGVYLELTRLPFGAPFIALRSRATRRTARCSRTAGRWECAANQAELSLAKVFGREDASERTWFDAAPMGELTECHVVGRVEREAARGVASFLLTGFSRLRGRVGGQPRESGLRITGDAPATPRGAKRVERRSDPASREHGQLRGAKSP